MPDDHSEVVPLLPIPNRTVKRLCADDSADSRVKVGHCQASIKQEPAPFGAGSCHFCSELASALFGNIRVLDCVLRQDMPDNLAWLPRTQAVLRLVEPIRFSRRLASVGTVDISKQIERRFVGEI